MSLDFHYANLVRGESLGNHTCVEKSVKCQVKGGAPCPLSGDLMKSVGWSREVLAIANV